MWYRLSDATSGVGYFPQITDHLPEYDSFSENGAIALSKYRCANPPFVPDLSGQVLHNKAIITDMLSAAGMGYMGIVVSERFKYLLQRFRLPNHEFFSTNIHQGNIKLENYTLFHTCEKMFDLIDFLGTKFYRRAHTPRIYVAYSTLEDFELNNLTDLQFDTLKINNKKNYDLIRFDHFSSEFYISHRLRNAIIEARITGVKLEELPWLTETILS